MYLAFTTKMTAIPSADLPPNDPAQPQIIHFAGILFDDVGRELDQLVTLVRPRPHVISIDVEDEPERTPLESAFHEGLAPFELFRWFCLRASVADALLGHNLRREITSITLLSAQVTGEPWWPDMPALCTMKALAPLLNLPPTARMIEQGDYGPRAPTLSECMTHLFNETGSLGEPTERLRASMRIAQRLPALVDQ